MIIRNLSWGLAVIGSLAFAAIRCGDPGIAQSSAGNAGGAGGARATSEDAGVIRCSANQIPCGGACADPRSDHDHCGACGVACAAGEVCDLGACKVSCSMPSSACGA